MTHQLLSAREKLLDEFDDGDRGDGLHMATITTEHRAEIEALIVGGRAGPTTSSQGS